LDEDDEEDIDFDDDEDFEGLLYMLSISIPNLYAILSRKFMHNWYHTCFICFLADDEDDMLEHYLAEKSDSSTHSSMRAS
jgi:hypothetical protein